jgi:hypothetical protein
MSENRYSPPVAQVADIEQASIDRPPLVTLGVRLLWAYIALILVQIGVDGIDIFDSPESGLWVDYLWGAAISLGIGALLAWLTWYAWKGRNWARVAHLILVIVNVLAVLLMLVAMYRMLGEVRYELPAFLDAWYAVQTLLNTAGVILLFTPHANAWYRALKKK